MFLIFILHTNLDIQIGFSDIISGFLVFQITRSGSVNNISSTNMFCDTLQDAFGVF